MSQEMPVRPDQRTVAFFDRSASEVVKELAERVYVVDTYRESMPLGTPKIVVLSTDGGEKNYRITLAEPYGEEDMSPVWGGKRLEQLKNLQPGEIIAFSYRSGTLSFIKTKGVENILIWELEEIEPYRRTKSATEVTNILGLSHGEIGRLTFSEEGKFKFERVGRV